MPPNKIGNKEGSNLLPSLFLHEIFYYIKTISPIINTIINENIISS